MNSLYNTVHQLLPSVNDEYVDLCSLDETHRLYLHGNMGIGKSYNLFALYHRLKEMRKDVRVLYIQDCNCALDQYEKLGYLLKEIFSADTAKDRVILKEINQIFPFTESNFDIAKIKKLFELILQKFGKKFVIILDQANILYSSKTNHAQNVKNIKKMFSSLFGLKNSVICVICSSDSQEFPQGIEALDNFTKFNVNRVFSYKELIAYAVEFKFLERKEFNSEIIEDLEFSTGKNPTEVHAFFKAKGNRTLEEAKKKFDSERTSYFEQAFNMHSREEMIGFIMKASTGCPITLSEFKIYGNCKLMYYEQEHVFCISSLMECQLRSFLFGSNPLLTLMHSEKLLSSFCF